jgi:2-amino-4-hydroxy-6-hydroxymethyldihydropteridine diphosphokinase
MSRAYLGLGSNVGDRRANLSAAIDSLDRAIEIDGLSWVYRTEPLGHARQPDFWNLAATGVTNLTPDALLEALHEIEERLGRERRFRYAPRTLDIDLLLFDDTVVSSPSLTVPHARMLDRAFVLRPLLDLSPGLTHPVTGRALADYVDRAEGRITRLFPGAELVR